MKLVFDFSKLNQIADEIGASTSNFKVTINSNITDFDSITKSLDKGIEFNEEFNINNIQTTHNLLSYQGTSIYLYIPYHESALLDDIKKDPKEYGRKIHVTECKSIAEMRSKGKIERYIAKHGLEDGELLDVKTKDHPNVWNKVKLIMCQTCLRELNYKDFAHISYNERQKILNEISINDLRKTYIPDFKSMPTRHKTILSNTYSANWREISHQMRQKANWKCTKCQVDLKNHRKLLDTHHIDSCRDNNDPSNLMVLCKLCHKNEYNHNHVELTYQDKKIIESLR